MADLGYYALVLAFLTAIFACLAFAFGGKKSATGTGRFALIGTFVLVSFAELVLLIGLLSHNFSLEYVASYSSKALPGLYLFSALWAGNAGSLLLWAWLLSLASFIVILNRRRYTTLTPSACSVLMLTESFFLLLLLATANPFLKITPPLDGQGLNPILQNPGMVIHPPALLAGYVLMAVPFAFVVAALITRKLDDDWTLAVRRWMLAAWLLLGAGNAIGMWWAYVELGWGGYWAWDPVENAGLMPWLVATAFLHSAIVQRQRSMFKVWTVSLVIIAFLLSIFGTYLTRSDILQSVHTFGDTGMSPYFIIFMLLIIVGSVYLVNSRRSALKSGEEMQSIVSRETAFMLTNMLLLGTTLIILLGTVFPAISEAFWGSRVGVGAPFFNRVNNPLFLVLILLAGVCTVVSWQQVNMGKLGRSLVIPGAAAIVTAVIALAFGARGWQGIAAYMLCGFVLASIVAQWVNHTRTRAAAKNENYMQAFGHLFLDNRSRYGAFLVHLGLAVMAIGIIGSSFYSKEAQGTLKTGQSLTVGDYTLTYQSTRIDHQTEQTIINNTLSVSKAGQEISSLIPKRTIHVNYNQPVTEVAIRSTLAEDLYVIPGETAADGSTFFKVLVNPLVDWIWIGAAVIVIGGLLAYWPSRTRKDVPETRPEPKPEPGKSHTVEEEIELEVNRLRRGNRA